MARVLLTSVDSGQRYTVPYGQLLLRAYAAYSPEVILKDAKTLFDMFVQQLLGQLFLRAYAAYSSEVILRDAKTLFEMLYNSAIWIV